LEHVGLAEPSARKAVELDPIDANALAVLSLVLLHWGENETAVEQGILAITTNPNSALCNVVLGRALAFFGRHSHARLELVAGIRLRLLDGYLKQSALLATTVASYCQRGYAATVAVARQNSLVFLGPIAG
jgi:hypothetical protein